GSRRAPDDDRGVLAAEAERVDLHYVDVQGDRLPGHHVELGGGVHVAGTGDVKERADPHRVRGGDDAHGAGRGTGVAHMALVRGDRKRGPARTVDGIDRGDLGRVALGGGGS